MREKELRLALVCYGGISLAVYMHGVTKELWRLAKASRAWHADGDRSASSAKGSAAVYHHMLQLIADETGLSLRVLIDIVAGASAGGINGVFLAQAIASGQSLEPLTDLWLDKADVEVLLDPDARPFSRFTKFWAIPIAWFAAHRRGGALDQMVAPEAQTEVRRKLAHFVRSRWFKPPFGGKIFSHLLLDAFDAMARSPYGPPLLPEGQPLDLSVTVTDFYGHPERLQLNSPPEVLETEHRLTLGFTDHGRCPRDLGHPAELAFAARATASFPGAFPPFNVAEMDKVLTERGRSWPGRDRFLARLLPRQKNVAAGEQAILIDGSVLANAPFRPAIDALRNRPARREVDRRFVYIDPTPGTRRPRASGVDARPGFFTAILGSVSAIPREQPIRDNLEALDRRSERIETTRRIIEAIQPEVENAIEETLGHSLMLRWPNAARLREWRRKANRLAAVKAGFAFAPYRHLKLSVIEEELTELIASLADVRDPASRRSIRQAVRTAAAIAGVDNEVALAHSDASQPVIAFFQIHDLDFRIRRLRFLAQMVERIEQASDAPIEGIQTFAKAIYASLAGYLDCQMQQFYDAQLAAASMTVKHDATDLLTAIAEARNLPALDIASDDRIAAALPFLDRDHRRTLLLGYLGFPFYDLATLALLRSEGEQEFHAIKVDRISPEDARSIRTGGAAATLRGIELNTFGAFFCRAYRENDYLWGRLHGAERLIDIIATTLPDGKALPDQRLRALKLEAFDAILAEEAPRLSLIGDEIARIRQEIDVIRPANPPVPPL